ncbi:MAG TPA: sensor histidine kinase [Thermoanaerobaculia bacterium]|nr:sensor histidine kinase [Thermoanaerobaculia bacterium]
MRALRAVGFLTWVIVAVPHVVWSAQRHQLFTPAGYAWIAAMLAFVVCFYLTTRDDCTGLPQMLLLVAQTVLALVCIALQPHGFIEVLLVIVAAQLGALPLRYAIAWVIVQSLAVLLFAKFDLETQLKLLGYFAFQLFGMFTARVAHDEHEAKQALAEANAELRVATGLLDMSSRAEERLRIARDLHDLIGHHLTALSLNLEVAGHLASGESREYINKGQAITKTLLADVRDVVSRLRENEPVDLAAALRSLGDVVKSPAIQIDARDAAVTNPAIAELALRAAQEIVTNAVRHSNARNLWLKVAHEGGALAIDAKDDGIGTDRVTFGNGLLGMRERVTQAGGTMEVRSMHGRGFEVHIRLPLEQPS